ncbi:MAG: inorganic phosphate transporter [Kiritimatiellae bacterium]|jgi:phosphate/sulfate permease|nr:inorganic phosphate transporter [Kiritimatiellia bacterium]NLD90584.1 inorganic phosphate transporter [Lentisphaerota bacterium]HPC20010.1 inorganic phosphate transporter [Kiritimatiellia bacterium]HQN79809.1 inorganic phosphate transporter [Kiritimatiellia bacterium]HQQ61345.1 inorganic phosphate transporter [Kiritimatiellia bacterium]
MPDFSTVLMIVAVGMLAWDCLEVGKNDAANLINGVFGARVMTHRAAVWLAGLAVLAGAMFSSPVIETARTGIFEPGHLQLHQAMVVYVSVYIVDTALLHAYSAYGMPVSTTASLIFELVGAAIGVSLSLGLVHWDKVGSVLNAILVSVLLTGIAGFLVQRVFRAAIHDEHTDHLRVLLHGPWIAGLMLTWLSWFMILKGMKAVPCIVTFREHFVERLGMGGFLLVAWGAMTLLVHMLVTIFQERLTQRLFGILAILGMLCLAFAFGQNDLANGASPGLSAFWLWRHADIGTAEASKMSLPIWLLAVCGAMLVAGMLTPAAQRVTRAAVNTGSQFDHIALYAPGWCRAIARRLLRFRSAGPDLAPPPQRTETGKRVHFDPLRAAVIMSVSASVIAFASSNGFPVSTTYVTFAAVVATGMGDRTMSRGDADLKIGRALWVVFSWFVGGFLALVAAGTVAWVLLRTGTAGLILALGGNLALRILVKQRADRHEQRYHPKTPQEIALEAKG